LLFVSFLAFVSMGLPDGLLGVAWPSVQKTFGLPLSQLGSLLLASGSGYLALSFLSGTIVARLGIGWLLVLSSVATVVSLTGYALAPAWPVMVALGFFTGAGAGAIDAGLNAYAATHFSHRVMNWMHACYGLGAMLGPLVMTAVLSEDLSWRWGYGIVGVALIGMTVSFLATLRLWSMNGTLSVPPAAPGVSGEPAAPAAPPASAAARGSMWHALRRPAVWAGVALFFVYVGVEFTAGQLAYSLMTTGRGVDPVVAGWWASAYYAALTVGRVAFGQAAARVPAGRLLRVGLVGSVAGATLIWWNPLGIGGFAGLALLGFALAPIFPLLMSETPDRVGRADSDHAVGFQISASSLGGAALPALAGVLARRWGLEVIGPYLLAATLLLWALHEAVVWRTSRAKSDVSPVPVAEPHAL
jgi:fucose permease